MHKYLPRTGPVRHRNLFAAAEPLVLPPAASLLPYLGPVKNQGQEGSCTGQAWSGLREFLYRKHQDLELTKSANPGATRFSAQFLYYQERELENTINQDSGADSNLGGEVLTRVGVCLEQDDPYSDTKWQQAPTPAQIQEAGLYKIKAYTQLASLQGLKQLLADGQVATMGILVYESFEGDGPAATGKIPLPNANREQLLGGHEVLAFGYDDTISNLDGSRGAVLVRNSWGSEWGHAGNFYLPYTYFADYVEDIWTGSL